MAVLTKTKWRPNRVGFLNFWYYDDEEFRFSNGKMLFRGENGSGKSVTMQSMFPFMLDGNKSPERLDPFNSRDRTMHDYLCGEKEINGVEERIGYLFVEYVKPGTKNEFITTIVGLQAKLGSRDVEFWGTVIHEQRVNVEGGVLLYEMRNGMKIPLQKRNLIKRFKELDLGDVVTSQKEYMELVNKHLFGFENLETFQHLIKLMVLLRSPKLSKDFKVSHMNDILGESLPELTSEELLPFTDSIENLDEIDELIRELQKCQDATDKLEQAYHNYNRFQLSEKARRYLQAQQSWSDCQKRYKHLLKQHHELEQYVNQSVDHLHQLEAEEQSLRERQRMLQNSEVFSLESELQNIKNNLVQITKEIEQAERTLASKQQGLRTQQAVLDACEQEIGECRKEIRELEGELGQCALEASYFDHQLEVELFRRRHDQTYNGFETWKSSARRYHSRLREVASKVAEEQSAKEAYQKSDDELSRLNQDIEDSRKLQADAWTHFDEERHAFLDLLHRWNEDNKQLHFSQDEAARLEHFVAGLYEECSFIDIQSILNQVYDRRLRVLDQHISELNHYREQMEESKSQQHDELQMWRSKKDLEPDRHPLTENTRAELKKAGVPFIPFYSAVEFRSDVPQEVRDRMEHAFLETGLLDALLVRPEDRLRVRNNNKVLVAGNKVSGATLSSYLVSADQQQLPVSEVQAILDSISVTSGESEFFLSADGSFKMGILEGVAPDYGGSQYIGKETRERFRQQKIAELEAALEDLKQKISSCKEMTDVCRRHVTIAKNEYDSFPSDKPMYRQFKEWENKKPIVKHLEDQLPQLQKNAQINKEQWQKIRNELLQKYSDVDVVKSPEAVDTATKFMDEYVVFLGQLELRYQQETMLSKSRHQTAFSIEETRKDIDGHSEIIMTRQADLNKHKLSAEGLEQLLQEKGAQSLRDEIARLDRRLSQVTQHLKDVLVQRTKTEAKMSQMETQFEMVQNAERFYQQFVLAWKDAFRKEASYGYVDELLLDVTDDDLMHYAKEVVDRLPLSESSLDELRDELLHVYRDVRDVLVGYQLEWREAETLSPYRIEHNGDELLANKLADLNASIKRIMITLDLNSKSVSPADMNKFLVDRVEDNKRYLSVREQELVLV